MNVQTKSMFSRAPNSSSGSIKMIRDYSLFLLLFGFTFLTGCEGGGSSSSDNGTVPSGTTGVGGSTARMTIDGNYLYAISSDSEVQLFDISQPASPSPWTRVQIGWDIETLFPYGDFLLIGAASGMFIMDNRDPANPQFIAEFTHATARDPVVAHDGYAYVTLRSDGFGFVNQLEVVDIRDIYNPSLVRTVSMQGPSGLTVGTTDNQASGFREELYVCDDIAGIKIFDLSDRTNPQIVDSIRDVNCNDVIAANGILYVITDNSLIQYDYTQTPPVKISTVTESEG